MKNELIKRDNCGTEAGYKKHKYHNEEQCQPCRDAHNVWRRDYAARNPDKNKQYRSRYVSKPEIAAANEAKKAEKAAVKAAKKQEQLDKLQAERDERKAARLAEIEANRAAKKAAHAEQMAINAEKRRIEVEAYRAEKKLKHEADKEARRVERERIRAEKAALKPAPLTAEEKEARKQGRIKANFEAKMARVVEHGTTSSMYELCKFQNGTACKPCKAAVAEYVRARPNKKRYNKQTDRNRRRYARENGRESYTRLEILERDDYTCHICSEKVDVNAPHDNSSPGWEMYPHLDHVIPLSKGGPDTRDNVRTAHARCNIDKRDFYDTPEVAVLDTV